MKNFLMRGVLLLALLSALILPASAAFSNTDSTNIANIKSYTYDIKTAVTSGTLASNVSSIKTSTANISGFVQTISTTLTALKGNVETISSRIGSSNQSGFTSLIAGIITIADKIDTSNSRLSDVHNDLNITNTRLSSTNSKLDSVSSNTSTTASNTTSIKTDSTNILSTVSSIANSAILSQSLTGLSTEAKQDDIILYQRVINTSLDKLKELLKEETYKSYAGRVLSSNNNALSYSNTGGFEETILDDFGLKQLGALFTAEKFSYNVVIPGVGSTRNYAKTPYGFLKNLSDTLASDEDKAIRDSQDQNVDQIKQDFITGSSGGSSLGKSDFGDLSTAGSTAKDLASLNGQASISKFTDGLTDANTSGMGWFSAETKSALDTVPASSTKRSPARDSDPYNMAGFSDNYNWLFGGD